MGQNIRSYEYSVQILAFQSFQIQNGDLKTIFHCSSSTIHRAAETAVSPSFWDDKWTTNGDNFFLSLLLWFKYEISYILHLKWW
jgi:hypothetical protein